MPLTRDQKVIEYITATGAYIKRAGERERSSALQAKQASELIPGVVEAVVASKLVKAAQSDRLARVLADPVKALEVLQKMAAIVAEMRQDAAPMGQGHPPAEKRASRSSQDSPFVGGRTTGVRDSDRALVAGLGLASA